MKVYRSLSTKASYEAYEKNHPGIRKQELPWRPLFTEKVLKEADGLALQYELVDSPYWSGNIFSRSSTYYQFKGMKNSPHVALISEPTTIGNTWNYAHLFCDCKDGREYCVHKAMMMILLEKTHGPWYVYENEYSYKRRLEKEQQELIIQDYKRISKEKGRIAPALDAFRDRKKSRGIILLDLERFLSSYRTTEAAIERMKELLPNNSRYYQREVAVTKLKTGGIEISFDFHFSSNVKVEDVWGTITRNGFSINHEFKFKEYLNDYLSLSGKNTYRIGESLDEFDLIALSLVWDKLDEEGSKSVTDDNALAFFESINKIREKESRHEVRSFNDKKTKTKDIELSPRIVSEDGSPMLSFKIGLIGSKKYILKDIFLLQQAVENEKKFVLGKKESLNFASQDFTEQSEKLYDFMKRNRTLSRGGVYQITFNGSTIDNFYDIALNMTSEYYDKTYGIKEEMAPIGHYDIKLPLTIDRLLDGRDRFIGVSMSGILPVMLNGSSYHYILAREGLSRLSNEEYSLISPYMAVADKSGYFRFQVGIDMLRDFYYRVIPSLIGNPYVTLDDRASEEARKLLPPEGIFNFFVDIIERKNSSSLLTLSCIVNYGGKEVTLDADIDAKTISDSSWRDFIHEQQVASAIRRFVPFYDQEKRIFFVELDDDILFDFLTAGLPELEEYGTVNGTSAFKQKRVISEPPVKIAIDVEGGGLLDISVTSEEVSTKELLAIYKSYTQKKRYFRLKSGDFVDLTEDRQLGEITDFLSSMDIVPMDVIKNKMAKIPLYRALYLDKMLENRNAITLSPDKRYRLLIKNFKTIKESDYEAPENLEKILRPYQSYGHKWLRTIQDSGFGGILADEMGLGKTLEMISVFEVNHREGIKKPSLVICPASLVYNWQEEIAKFAPALKTTVINGTAKTREKIITESTDSDVFITSYDMLKRDIALYENVEFSNCVLDEAQYIKNSNAAVTKSVKLISADHRFALTGTPIENRLSELWSIFDFLMPNFLYTKAEFERKFELPISKFKEEKATLALKNMTSPFILRRKKEDVLSDLPQKLEEVRYVRLSGKQQKLYDAQVLFMKGLLKDSSSSAKAGEEKVKIIAEFTKIREICCDPSLLFKDYNEESAKREACLDLVRSAIEGGHRMLIFSQFVSMLELLEKDLQNEGIEYYKIVGATSKEKRINLVKSFNDGSVPVFLISLKAGGTGLNLTGADVVIHYDPWWNLAAQNQATDRSHRIGQTKQVTVYKLIVKDSVEERILALQNAKKELADAILEGSLQSLFSLSQEELLALLG